MITGMVILVHLIFYSICFWPETHQNYINVCYFAGNRMKYTCTMFVCSHRKQRRVVSFFIYLGFGLFYYISHQNLQIWCAIEVLARSGTSCVHFSKFYWPNSVTILIYEWKLWRNQCSVIEILSWLELSIMYCDMYHVLKGVLMICILSKNVNDTEP